MALDDVQKKKPAPSDLIQDCLKKFDKDSIHKFRVEIKKIKAAILLIHIADPSFYNKKKYGGLRQLYGDLGEVREVQLQQDKFKANKQRLNRSFTKKYNTLLEEELVEWQNITLEHFNEQLIKLLGKLIKKIKKALKKLSSDDYKKYFKVKINRLSDILVAFEFSDEKMHDLRKLIKEIKFNSRFKPNMAEKRLAKNDITPALLEELQKLLGDWQDNAVLKQKLMQRQSILNLKSKGEQEAFQQYKTGIEVEDRILKDKIKKALKMSY